MSRSVKHEKSTGFLDNIAKIRKHRKEAREQKELLLDDIDFTNNLIFAQEI